MIHEVLAFEQHCLPRVSNGFKCMLKVHHFGRVWYFFLSWNQTLFKVYKHTLNHILIKQILIRFFLVANFLFKQCMNVFTVWQHSWDLRFCESCGFSSGTSDLRFSLSNKHCVICDGCNVQCVSRILGCKNFNNNAF